MIMLWNFWKEMMTMSNYTQDNIQTLSPLEAIRKKKGMYFGSNNSKAISHVAKEIISNSIDEFLAGYATTIDIAVSEKQNYVQITDNGRGIPVEKLEDVFTKPHTTGKEKDGGGYATSGGINGIGTKLATATGRIDCTIVRDGKTATGYYEYGKPFTTKIEKSRKKGSSTTVKWQPHKETFEGNGIEYEPIDMLCRELSYITPNLIFKLLNVDTNKSVTYKSNNIGEYIDYLNAGTLLSPIMTYTGVENTVKLDLAVAWSDKAYQEKSYINIIPTNDGGTHITAFKSTLTRQWNNYFSTSHKGDDVRQGLIVVLSIKTTEEAVFSGQSKDKLDMPSITQALNSLLANAFSQFFKTNESFFKEFNKALKKQKDRQEVAELMNSLHKKSYVKQDAFSEISSKYTGCFNDKNIELFLGEGESAATPIALVKDSNNQATYELKGKLKNIFEKPITEAMQSQEIKELIQILGKPNEAERKFSKIIIASDADHDGSHIALLILGFLATFYPNLLQKGRVYRLVTPILMARKGEKYEFAYEESSEWSHSWASKGYEIVRFKGLGQINLNTIKPFIVDNPQRKLAQYNVDDWEAFYESLTVALSSDRIIDRKELLIGG